MERSQGTALSGRSIVHALVLAVLLLGVACSTKAQSTATLQGTVTDPSGAAVANAKVAATNQATGVRTDTASDTAGAFLIPSLSIGLYRLEISASGFQTTVLTGLKLEVATTVTKNVTLTLGNTSQTVEVVATVPLVDVSTNSIGQVINDKTVQQIPLNGRHFTDLSLLTPGTITPPANGFLSAPLRGQGSFGINTAGQREDTTNWLVNGVNLNDNSQNQITFQPPIDTLAEYKIDNSSFPAQYGRNSGAIVNLATRSGTNEYHGELFEFIRNNALDARNFFNVREGSSGLPLIQSPFRRNDFGVDFGGPIIKNKLFFFLAYEGLRQSQNITLSTTVPSVNDRSTVTAPAIQKLLTLIPAANLVGTGTPGVPNTFNLFSGGVVANVSLNQGSGDIDYELSQIDRFHFYYVVQKDLRQEPTLSNGAIAENIPGFGDTRDGFRQLLSFSEDHTFSTTLNNTVRLGFNRIHLTFTPNGLLDPANFGITMPAGSPAASGLPFFNVGGTIGFGGPLVEPQGRGDTTVVLNDGLSWLKGRHTFTFGGEIRRAYNNNIAFNIGSLSYTSVANFLADSANAFTVQLGSGNDKILAPSYDVFAQDSFKWKPNLTINVGLRYAWNATPSESIGRFTNVDPLTGALVAAGQPYQQNNLNFQPRVGFAWDPFKNGKTSVRGAYAIMTQAPTTNILQPLSGNPPFALPISVSSATNSITAENPSATVTAPSLGPAAINPGFDNSYAQDWNLSIQRQVTQDLGLEVAYIGVKGTHLQLTQNINQPLVTDGFYGSTKPFPALPTTTAPNLIPPQCQPSCLYNNINQVNSGGNSSYNAVWITANKHVSRGLEFLATYTYSKSIDYNSLSGGETYIIQNAYNPRGDRGLSEFDVRNRFALSGFYQFPFKGNRLISGWQVGLFFQAQSGSPLNPTLSIGPGPGISLTVRPDLLAPIHTTGNPTNWFSNAVLCEPFNGTPTGGAPAIPACATTANATIAVPCTFSDIPVSANPASPNFKVYPIVPGTCHPGTLGRNAITGPDFVNTDFSVTKDTKITERFNLEFRCDMFDVFNHPNFGNPVLTATSKSLGLIGSTRFPTGDFGSSRQIQFSLFLQF